MAPRRALTERICLETSRDTLPARYELGHLDIMAKLEAAEAQAPGLYVTGNYRTGVAFPDCVTFGYDFAKVVADESRHPHGERAERLRR